jgi:hypothetical protein
MTGPRPLPFDPPFASTVNPQNPCQSGPVPSLAAGKTPRETRTRRHSERLGRHGLAALASELSERDWAVLRDVAGHRFLTTKHVERLHFTHHTTATSAARTCRQVLQRLRQLRVLHSLDRRVGGIRAGSASYVWTTGPVGRRLLDSVDNSGRARRHQEPSERFLQHALAIADVHLALVEADRRRELELLRVELEPACWRPYTAAAGNRAVLQPDLAITTGAGEFEDAWFLEVDLGNEHLPTLLRKCELYQTYRLTGIEQERFGGFPLVVWLLSSQHRVDQFQAASDRSRVVDDSLLRIITPAELLPLITTNNQPRGGDHE